jgi:branched-chain amino acid transport system substrate-binding protein
MEGRSFMRWNLIGKLSFIFLSLSFSHSFADTIKFGVYGAMSGGASPLALSMRKGIELAVEEINSKGGILGNQIQLVIRDDEAKNEKGAPIVQEFADREKVVAIFGPTNTGVADASTKYTNKRKIPQMISVAAGAKVNEYFKETKDNYIFRVAASDDVQSKVIVTEAIKARKFKKPAILCDDTNFGQAGRERLEKNLEAFGVKPVYVGKFKIKDTDMSAQLQEAKSKGSDVILGYGIGPEMAAVSNSMERIGWKVPLIGAWTLSSANYINNAGKNAEGSSMPQSFIEHSKHSPLQENFLKTYWKKYNEKPIAAAIPAVQAYDSVYLMKAAIEQAQSLEGPKIKNALEDLKTPHKGLIMNYNKPFSNSDHDALKAEHIRVGVIKNSIVVPKESL